MVLLHSGAGWLFPALVFPTALLPAYTGEEVSCSEVRPRLHVHYFCLEEEQVTICMQLVRRWRTQRKCRGGGLRMCLLGE